ncbi:MAG: hypothetical protein RSE00_01580 [Clostridia bacterium]
MHSDCAQNTIDRLITLFKRDIRAQQYKESFIGKILSSSIDYIIYLENYKVCQIASVKFDNIKGEAILKEEYILINKKKEEEVCK